MGYPQPPRSVFFSANTNGVANTDTTHTLVASPGAGFGLRVSFIGMSYAPNNTGNVELRNSVAGEFQHCMQCGPTGPSSQLLIPGPGFALGAATALRTVSRSNVITQAFRVAVYYYIDTLQ